MSEPQKKFKLTHELRIVVASLLSLVVILLWAKYFGPKPPTNLPQANRPAQTAPATPGSSTPSGTSPLAKSTPGSKGPATSISGVVHGSWLTLKRLLRCHPLSGKFGYDPVPEVTPSRTAATPEEAHS